MFLTAARLPAWLALAIAMVGLLPAAASSQTTRADTARVLIAIVEDLADRGEEERARELLALVLERYGDTPLARAAADRLAHLRSSRPERGGESELIAWNTLYGAALGLMVPAALGAEEGEPYGAGLLIGAPLGFLASRAYASSRTMTPGHARAITFGTWWGTWQAIGWQEVADLGDEDRLICPDGSPNCFASPQESETAPFAAAVIGGLAGLGVGAVLGQNRPISASTALVTNFSALWGTWYGLAVGFIGDAEDDALLASMLVGGNAGLLVGALGAPHMRMSTGRAWLVHLSGIVGLAAGGGLDLLLEPEDDKLAMMIPTISSALGLAIGFATTSPVIEGPGPGFSGALARYVDGDWEFGMPLPLPGVMRDAGQRPRLQLRVDLLRASW